jgi:hypothetical protein
MITNSIIDIDGQDRQDFLFLRRKTYILPILPIDVKNRNS